MLAVLVLEISLKNLLILFDNNVQENHKNFVQNKNDEVIQESYSAWRHSPRWFKTDISRFPVPVNKNEFIAVDFVGPLPKTQDGKRFRLTFIDC